MQMLASGRIDAATMQTLLMFEMVRHQMGPGAGPTDGGLDRGTTIGRSFRRMQSHTQRIYEQPDQIVAEWTEMVMAELGAHPYTPWRYPDLHRRIAWGKHRGLQRSFILLMEILELLEAGHVPQARALCVQAAKAHWQTAIDGGQWHIGWQLTGIHDPLRRRVFAGIPTEMEVAAEYVRGLEDL